jgi:hypothetical protein
VHFLSEGRLSEAMQPADLLREGALEELFFGVRT